MKWFSVVLSERKGVFIFQSKARCRGCGQRKAALFVMLARLVQFLLKNFIGGLFGLTFAACVVERRLFRADNRIVFGFRI
jgi:hypothetical protein